MSFKAIDTNSPTDDKQWLTYWVVFGFTSIVSCTWSCEVATCGAATSEPAACGTHASLSTAHFSG